MTAADGWIITIWFIWELKSPPRIGSTKWKSSMKSIVRSGSIWVILQRLEEQMKNIFSFRSRGNITLIVSSLFHSYTSVLKEEAYQVIKLIDEAPQHSMMPSSYFWQLHPSYTAKLPRNTFTPLLKREYSSRAKESQFQRKAWNLSSNTTCVNYPAKLYS